MGMSFRAMEGSDKDKRPKQSQNMGFALRVCSFYKKTTYTRQHMYPYILFFGK